MTMNIRFEHKTVGGYYVITSPDLIGFHVSGKTPEEAERAAMSVLDFLRHADRSNPVGRIRAVQLVYDAA